MYWKKAVQANPKGTAALSGLARTHMERQEYDKAARYYEMWQMAEPDNSEAKTGLAKAKRMGIKR